MPVVEVAVPVASEFIPLLVVPVCELETPLEDWSIVALPAAELEAAVEEVSVLVSELACD